MFMFIAPNAAKTRQPSLEGTVASPGTRVRRLRAAFGVLLAVTGAAVSMGASAATYYIDYVAGSDTNDGKSTATPWRAHPFMACRMGGTYTHAAGDRFIFKGGSVWPAACFEMAIRVGGVSGTPDYYGVDKSWFVGTGWTRPVFNGQHQALNGGGNIVAIGSASNLVIDGVDIRGHRTFVAANQTGSIRYDCPTNVIMKNLWVHDWSVASSVSQDNGQGGVYGSISGCSPSTVWVEYSELSNAEWTGTGRQSGAALRGGNCRYCVIHDASTGILHGTMHDTHMYNISNNGNNTFDRSFHTNSLYVDNWEGVGVNPGTKPALIYNNYIHDVGSGSGAIYPNPRFSTDTTIYIFNNVVRNTTWLGAVNVDTYCYGCSAASVGKVYIWNNTFQVGPNGNGFPAVRVTPSGASRPALNTLVMQNNHSIDDNGLYGGGSVVTLSNSSNLSQTNAQAAAQGYAATQTFAFSPTQSTAGTVGKGVNLSSKCALLASLCYDTTYGSLVSGPAVKWPARAVNGRSAGAAWDIGAYQLSGATVTPPPAPTGLTVQ